MSRFNEMYQLLLSPLNTESTILEGCLKEAIGLLTASELEIISEKIKKHYEFK